MANKVNINGKLVRRPGVYALVKSGIQNSTVRLDYGVVCIIDDGIGAGYGGGEGGKKYEFDRIQDFQNFVKGGPLWDLAIPLWKPVPNKSIQGISQLVLIQARATTQATISYTLTNGAFDIKTKDEGLNANGVLNSNATPDLKTGYATKLVNSGSDYFLEFYHGAYRGLDALNNTPYDGISANDDRIKGLLMFKSIACTTVQGLLDWMATSSDFAAGFELATGATATGALVVGDVETTYNLATGATETYDSTAFTAAKNVAKAVSNNFFLAMKYDADADHADNDEILSDVIGEGKYDRFIVIGGGKTAAELATVSIAAAEHFNSDKVIIVHGEGLNAVSGGFKKRSPLWKAADVLGRICGLEPQTPVTFKSTGLDAEADPLSEQQLEDALDAGVLTTYTDEELGYNVVQQGINTLQTNEHLVNEDGTSYSIQVKRITAQINKEVALYLKRKFFGKDTVGPNRNTVTEADLVAATEGYLQRRTASSNQDNLIIRFGNIIATTDENIMRVSYEFVPNFEVDIIIVTGIILEK